LAAANENDGKGNQGQCAHAGLSQGGNPHGSKTRRGAWFNNSLSPLGRGPR
jgi:hypothetical protein